MTPWAREVLRDRRASLSLLDCVEAVPLTRFAQVEDGDSAANETHADCLRMIVRAEMRMADEIDEKPSAQGRRTDLVSDGNEVPTIEELGVSRKQVHEWRETRDAGIGPVEFAVAEALTEDPSLSSDDSCAEVRTTSDLPEHVKEHAEVSPMRGTSWIEEELAVATQMLARKQVRDSTPAVVPRAERLARGCRRWRPDEIEELRRMAREEYTAPEVARALSRSENAVRHRAWKFAIFFANSSHFESSASRACWRGVEVLTVRLRRAARRPRKGA